MAHETLLRAVLALEILAMLAIRLYYHSRAVRAQGTVAFKESKLQRLIQALLGTGCMVTALAYLINPAWMAWSSLPLPLWVRWFGAALGAVSITLLLWVQRALGKNFSTVLHVRSDHTLVTSGPYRTVRHPMYSVLFLLSLGFTLIAANWSIGLFWIGSLIAVIIVRIDHEEAVMLEQFGDQYREYMHRTNRFLPRLAH